MDGEKEQTNNSEINYTINNTELYLNEEQIIKINSNNNTNTIDDTNNNKNNLENDEEIEGKVEEIDFEQIKKNHMLKMNNINMSTFENDSSSNFQRPNLNIPQNNQYNNNFPYYQNNMNNINTFGTNYQNIGFQAIQVPQVNQGMMMMPFNNNLNIPFPQQNAFIPPPPRLGPPNQMNMHNQNYFFDCNPFAFFMQRKTSNNYNNKNAKDRTEEKPFFFSFSNTLLANNQNKNQEENNQGIDLTKMTRLNVKFVNPFNGSNYFIFYKHFHKQNQKKKIKII